MPDIVDKLRFRHASRQVREEAGRAGSALESYPIREFRLRIPREDGTVAWLNMSVSLAYPSHQTNLKNELMQKHAEIYFILSNTLQGKKLESIDEEPEKVVLKTEIEKTVNSVLDEGKISTVYFNEFVFLPD